MEFSVYRQDLIKVIGHMQSVVERRATLPILMNVKLEAKEGLTLSATNVDLELVEKTPADVTIGNSITIPVQRLYDILKKLPETAEIKFKQSGDQIILTSGNGTFTLPTLPAENFPMMAGAHLPTKFSMSTDDLIYMIDKTQFAIPTDDVRYHLGGIYFHLTEEDGKKYLSAVATDSQRLSLCSIPMPADAEGMPSVILPKRVIGELKKLLDDAASDDVVVELSETKVRFTIGNAVLTSKLVDAQYPNYKVVIPKDNDKIATMKKKEFIDVIDRVSSVATSDKSNPVLLTFSMNKLNVSASSSEGGSATEDMTVEYNGDDDKFVICFNVRYLMDIAEQVEGEDMQILMMGPTMPTIIQSKGKKDPLFILMPQRI